MSGKLGIVQWKAGSRIVKKPERPTRSTKSETAEPDLRDAGSLTQLPGHLLFLSTRLTVSDRHGREFGIRPRCV